MKLEGKEDLEDHTEDHHNHDHDVMNVLDVQDKKNDKIQSSFANLLKMKQGNLF